MYNKEQLIKDFIKFYSTDSVATRGKTLYNNYAVRLDEYDDKADIWMFSVQGSKEYQVRVTGISNNNIDTSCSCPFDWGSVCKHSIAALHYISDNIDEDISPIIRQVEDTNNRFSKESKYEINQYKEISEDWILDNIDYKNKSKYLYYSHNNNFENFSILENKMFFEMYYDYTTYEILIEKIEDKFFISSSEQAVVSKLKLSEAYCLHIISESPTPDLIYKLLDKGINEYKAKTLVNFGLPIKANFEEYFQIGFDSQNGIVINSLKNSVGLLPVTDKLYSPLLANIQDTEEDFLPLPNLKTEIEKREIGFVFKFINSSLNKYSSDFFFEGNTECRIIPIIGKPNKSGTLLSSFIEEYDSYNNDKYTIHKSDKIKEVLNILELLDYTEDDASIFQYKKRIFNLLIGQNFIFTIKEGRYEIKKTSLEQINLSPDELDIYYNVSSNSEFIQTEIKIKINDIEIDQSKINFNKSDIQIFTIDDITYCAKNYEVGKIINSNHGPLKMVKTHKDLFFDKVVKPISKNFEVKFNEDTYTVDTIELDFHKKQIFLTEQNGYLIITPRVVYDNDKTVALYKHGDVLVKNNEHILEYKRNHELEYDFVEQIAELHPNFENQKSKRLFYLHMDEFVENLWFYKFFDQLTTYNVEIFGLKDLKNFKYSPYKGKISTSVSSGQDWFEVNLDVSFGDNSVSLQDIRKAVLNKEKYIRLKDGSVGIMPTDWFHKLEKYFRNGEIKNNSLEISKLRFSIVDELFDNIDDAEIIEELTEKKKRLASFTEISNTIVPKEITADLRHYQKEGLNWLNFLDEMQWGGILADDMGLGKTLQILTFIQHLHNKENSTNLIVVPTTLLFNWQNEIKKFSPNLKAFYHYGTDRPRNTNGFKKYNIIFTTYGILIRDIKMLQEFKFNYAILDESQAIKNPASRRYKAANLIQSNNRIALSGTPIENSTFDLFAQMNFVNRGMLGGVSMFKENYSNPIDKEGDESMANELQKVVSPFILRRTKENVASELPSKTEDIIYCEMEDEQRKVYDAFRNNYKNQLLQKITDEGIGKSKMMVLAALTRLRQICDSPELIKDEELHTTQSVKIKEILRHITNKTANHKILIFSQFVKMLGLVKSELDKMNIKYEYLDGKCSIKQREQSVQNFQENDELRVFLISLKAGGTGLNLTAADYVYILDPWWNPAVENQAIDRCYRIGQDKKVFAYRMICKNTVEEKIMALQQKKKKIAGDIIQTDENIMKTINSDDIKELFS